MIRGFRALLAAMFVASTAVFATPQVTSGNELWIQPLEPGWGLNLFHQGDTMFASLFVYGPDGQPKWYTASDLRSPDTGITNFVTSGPLYESTGPWFGGPFNTSAVTRRQVGDMRISIGTLGVDLFLDYTIDGVKIHKDLKALAFGRADPSGTYAAFASCCGPPPLVEEMSVIVNQSGSSFTMVTQSASRGSCTYTGTYSQSGQLGRVSGNSECSGGVKGFFSMTELDVTYFGFTSRFVDNRFNDPVFGRLSGTRTSTSVPRGVGMLTDLWLNPDESGWGLNIVEQGDTLFGTLFVYDPSGRPRWYSASNLVSNGGATWSGSLVESTGPYFGAAAFNSSAVNRRVVGTMRFDQVGRDAATVQYTIDGVTVTKSVRRLTFRYNDLVGNYAGHVEMPPPNASIGGVPLGATSFAVTDSPGGGTTITTHAAGGDCTFSGQPLDSQQYGQYRLIAGTYSCTGGGKGRFFLSDVDVTFSGFTGMLTADGFGVANVAGTRIGGF